MGRIAMGLGIVVTAITLFWLIYVAKPYNVTVVAKSPALSSPHPKTGWIIPKTRKLEIAENSNCLECNVKLWQLRLMPQNVTVSFADMFERAECEALKAEIEPQLKPFTDLVCVEVWAQREKI